MISIEHFTTPSKQNGAPQCLQRSRVQDPPVGKYTYFCIPDPQEKTDVDHR